MDDSPNQMQKISEAVKTFVNRNQSKIDIQCTPVCDKRTMVINIRKTLENFPERMTWKERPSYWSTNVCFGDPNNELKNNESVNEMLLFLVDEWRRRHQLEEPLDNSVPVTSGIHRATLSANDWQPIKEYNRLRNHLKALPLPIELKHKLLEIVDIWVADDSKYHAEAHDLEAIVDKMKLSGCKEQSLLDTFHKFIAESAGMAVHSVQETVMIPEDSLPEPISLREDPELEVSSSLMEISACLVGRQKWLNESSCGGNESLEEEEHSLHVEDHCEKLTWDLSLKQDCELLSNIVAGEDGEMPRWDLQPFLSYWKNIKGINLKDINGSTVLKYLKKMVENHPTFYIHNFHQLDSNVFLDWSNDKNKLLLPYKDTNDGHFSLLFADRVERIVSVLDSVQIDTEKLKQSFVNRLPVANWRSVEIECPRLKRDSGLSDTCVSAYFTLMFAEAIVNGMMPIEFRQEFIPEFKVWLDYTLCSDRPVAGLFDVLSRLRGNCGVCSRVEPFPNFLELLKKHAVT